LWWALQKDVYGREQDLEGLCVTPLDVTFAHFPGGGVQAAVFFGLRERGESVKTGSDQGVIVDSQWVSELLREFFASRPTGGPLFSISRARVWQQVLEACRQLGIPPPGDGLHLLRHTGAAADVYAKRRILEQVRIRGRWVSPSSVQRYTAVARLVADFGRLPAHVAQYGAAFLRHPTAFAHLRCRRRVTLSVAGSR
jgi:hypothetical protein